MASICPTVLAENPHQFREQIERVAAFATQIHLDFADGSMTDNKTIELSQAWWPHTMQADLHIMYKKPEEHLEEALALNPRRVIVHAEADVDLKAMAERLHQAGVAFGVALLPDTKPGEIADDLDVIDYVLIFSGSLGHFGGEVHYELLDKAKQLKELKDDLTIGWDGGIDDQSVKKLADGGVDVLNVGGFLQRSEDALASFRRLQKLLQ